MLVECRYEIVEFFVRERKREWNEPLAVRFEFFDESAIRTLETSIGGDEGNREQASSPIITTLTPNYRRFSRSRISSSSCSWRGGGAAEGSPSCLRRRRLMMRTIQKMTSAMMKKSTTFCTNLP
jgi:hypothetical protein